MIVGRRLEDQHVDLGERGVYHRGNRLNDLTGKEWVFATRSVMPLTFPPSYQHALRSQHGGQKPPELCEQLIRTFTKAGQRVLDPFMGVGGTLLGAGIAGREAVGIETNPRWVEVYREVCRREGLPEQTALVGDSRKVLPALAGPFDLVLTDVPFWDMDQRRRSTGKWKRAGEEAQEKAGTKLNAFNDGHAPQSREEWLGMLREVFTGCRPLLKPKGYLVSFIGDMYHSGRYHPLNHYLADLLEELGYTFKANLIWYDVSKKLRVYGFKYEFIPSMTHQNILVFRNG